MDWFGNSSLRKQGWTFWIFTFGSMRWYLSIDQRGEHRIRMDWFGNSSLRKQGWTFWIFTFGSMGWYLSIDQRGEHRIRMDWFGNSSLRKQGWTFWIFTFVSMGWYLSIDQRGEHREFWSMFSGVGLLRITMNTACWFLKVWCWSLEVGSKMLWIKFLKCLDELCMGVVMQIVY
jgi:hypothetical protein